MNREELSAALSNAGLARVAEAIASRSRPSYRLFAEPRDDIQIAIGSSKVGGAPDLPRGASWPHGLGNYMSFVAQVNLEELPAAGLDRLFAPSASAQQQGSFFEALNLPEIELPRTPREHLAQHGLLSFFYELEAGLRGYGRTDTGTCAALHTELSASELERSPIPEPILNPRPLRALDHVREPAIFRPLTLYFSSCALTFEADLSLPASADDLPDVSLSEVEEGAYWDFMHPYIPLVARHLNARADGRPSHQMLGYSRSVQWGTTPPGQSLLLQLDSDPEANMLWGDVGILYYFMPTEELHAANFANVYAYEDMH